MSPANVGGDSSFGHWALYSLFILIRETGAVATSQTPTQRAEEKKKADHQLSAGGIGLE